MTLIMLLIIVYTGLYVLLSIPSFQEKVKKIASEEVSVLLGGNLTIGNLTLRPFSEVEMTGVTLESPDGDRCAGISEIAAGIDMWSLFADRRIILNYVEIIGLDADIEQTHENGPLNIKFLIDALSPKDRNKPKTKIDLRIRNIVIRDSKARLSRPWMKDREGKRLPFADIQLTKLRMDLSIPVLRNDLYRFDIRNMQFDLNPGINIRGLHAGISYIPDLSHSGNDRISIRDFTITLPNSALELSDIDIYPKSLSNLRASLSGHVTPSDFSQLVPVLSGLETPWSLDISAGIIGNGVEVTDLMLDNEELESSIALRGNAKNINSSDSIDVSLEQLKLRLSRQLIVSAFATADKIAPRIKDILSYAGNIEIDMDGSVTAGERGFSKGIINTDHGSLDFDAEFASLRSKRPQVKLTATGEEIELGNFLATDRMGEVSFTLDADIAGFDRSSEGKVTLTSGECVISGVPFTEIDLMLEKQKNEVDLSLAASAEGLAVDVDANCTLAGKDTQMYADIDIDGFSPSQFGLKGNIADCVISSGLRVRAKGNSADNITGQLELSDLSLEKPDAQKLELSRLNVSIDSISHYNDTEEYYSARELSVESDWLDARVTGEVHASTIVKELRNMISTVFPTLIEPVSLAHLPESLNNQFDFSINLKGVSAPYTFFNLPVRPLTDIPLTGLVDAKAGNLKLDVSTPHLLQGKNKLISDLKFSLSLDSFLGMARVATGLIYPAKKGNVELAADINAARDKVNVGIDFNPTMQSSLKGGMAFAASFSKIADPFNPKGKLAVHMDILPSAISVNKTSWSIADGAMDYSGKRISIDNFLISHEDQYIKIDGTASDSPSDLIKVKLNDIDLEYIFNILNINYVSFGGRATGEVSGSLLLTKNPEARTDYLYVKDLSYNGAVLGNGDLASEYDSSSQSVGIHAVIRDPLTRQRRASVEGGIWITRDSLSFNFDADKINIGFMKPFVAAFCSDLSGEASGKCKLYGTFSDIDLTGGLLADTLSMKLDFTNTFYHAGGDSVYLRKGIIDIPPLTLYDDEGHTAEFGGWLRHTYFHDPVFSFKLREAKSLLCYNTTEKNNPLWYGTIFGSGQAQINGHPGLIEVDINMTTDENSKFYYVISDAEDIAQYSFLSFTDKRKEKLKAEMPDTVPDYLKNYRKASQDMEASSSNVILSLKGTVTNDALVTLVMDPRAGDNITARGEGALQMDYNMASNDLRMIGTYILDEGNYNFTLQDIIIKNFNIRKGSLIKFDGDPMNANLDIAATYRVNTNLTDLDKSFSTDKELNRTNVPVDALLIVKGPMTNPDISFDIELPSLTSDVERKVKSIVSTNDMMSRQIIYLLALNRFYTPEYTGGSSNGSEWSSMASSTISSQLSNILSQMTDKLDVAPSFRSEKGDFTDMEFDLALSSRLLNNRLLINGNFGYRDRSTSNTQFVGDFDIEYLLSKNGNLRLKAYNHFNDQNYYLRSALTTQGVGVVFRKDFDRMFRRKKEEDENERRADSDSIADKTAETVTKAAGLDNEYNMNKIK